MILLGALAVTGECVNLAFPTARWFFGVSREVPFLGGKGFLWFGWLSVAILVLGGLTLIVHSFTSGPRNPITTRRVRRFCDIKRGYYSLLIFLALGGLAAVDQVVVGKRALAVQYGGKWVFPAFLPPI